MFSAVPAVSISATRPVICEGGAPVVYTVRRTGPTDEPLSVNLLLGGTATAGSDYRTDVPLDQSVQIPAGRSRVTVRVFAQQDQATEQRESVTLAIEEDEAYQVRAGHHSVESRIRDRQSRPRIRADRGWWPIIDADLQADADRIRAAALRELITSDEPVYVALRRTIWTRDGHQSGRSRQAGSTYEDPSDALIKALSGSGREVRKYSEAQVTETGLYDPTTGKRAKLIWAEDIHGGGPAHFDRVEVFNIVNVTVGLESDYAGQRVQASWAVTVYRDAGAWTAIPDGSGGVVVDAKFSNDLEAIQEAMLREVLGKNGIHFVSVLRRTEQGRFTTDDPSDAMLQRLRASGYDVRPYSEAPPVGAPYIDPATGSSIGTLRVERVGRQSDRAEVKVTWGIQGISVMGETYTLAQQDGSWTVVESKLDWFY